MRAYLETVPLFLHLPKCAGTTLTNILYDLYRGPVDSREEHDRFIDGIYYYPDGFIDTWQTVPDEDVRRALGRPDVGAVVGHFSFGVHRCLSRPWRYVTIVRDPVERVLSLYNHLARDWSGHRLMSKVSGIGPDVTLDSFLSELRLRETDNDQTRRLAGVRPPFGACTREMLSEAMSNIDAHFAVAGTLGRFDETLLLLHDSLGWPEPPRYLPDLVNPAPATSLSPANLERIVNLNRLDLELYDFVRDRLEARISAGGQDLQCRLDAFRDRNREHMERFQPIRHPTPLS